MSVLDVNKRLEGVKLSILLKGTHGTSLGGSEFFEYDWIVMIIVRGRIDNLRGVFAR